MKAREEYERWHARLDVDIHSDTPWHRLVKRHLDPGRDLRGRRVLEIACGRGGFGAWLTASGADRLVQSDFSFTAASKAAAHVASSGAIPRLAVGDIQALGHPAASFDTVISCETIEHVPSPGAALRELARVLRPGGRLFLTTPNYFGTMGLFRGYLRLRGRPYTEEGQPINRFMMLPATVGLVRRAGLRVERIDAVGHYLPFPGRPPIEFPLFDRPRAVMKWTALHSFILARKP